MQGVGFAVDGVEDVREQKISERPAVRDVDLRGPRGATYGKVLEQDGRSPGRKLAAPETPHVNAVVPLEIGFYGVGVVSQGDGEPRQFPRPTEAVSMASNRAVMSETLRGRLLNVAHCAGPISSRVNATTRPSS